MFDSKNDQIFQIINSTFSELGVNPPFIETVLLSDCRYVGRKFRAGGYQIIWWIEKNVVEVFDQDGQTVQAIDLGQLRKMSA